MCLSHSTPAPLCVGSHHGYAQTVATDVEHDAEQLFTGAHTCEDAEYDREYLPIESQIDMLNDVLSEDARQRLARGHATSVERNLALKARTIAAALVPPWSSFPGAPAPLNPLVVRALTRQMQGEEEAPPWQRRRLQHEHSGSLPQVSAAEGFAMLHDDSGFLGYLSGARDAWFSGPAAAAAVVGLLPTGGAVQVESSLPKYFSSVSSITSLRLE
jgi:hypothetical protein